MDVYADCGARLLEEQEVKDRAWRPPRYEMALFTDELWSEVVYESLRGGVS